MNHATDAPPTESGGNYRMDFTVGEHSAGHMRRILRLFLTRWELPELADSAELALTELVANVVRHVPDRNCAVLILRRPQGLRIEVSDGDPRPARPLVPYDEAVAEHGRGLRLVDAVTDRWGSEPGPTGKTVWFECDGKRVRQ
ncbi:ATP-binding protein [Streptomyces sp. NPDC086023]|uniref:ATP-binding protein n=1 Tax=Streptomyces sp. NPDC086023 TaxID=3365746 RepID=UPI0037CFCA15